MSVKLSSSQFEKSKRKLMFGIENEIYLHNCQKMLSIYFFGSLMYYKKIYKIEHKLKKDFKSALLNTFASRLDLSIMMKLVNIYDEIDGKIEKNLQNNPETILCETVFEMLKEINSDTFLKEKRLKNRTIKKTIDLSLSKFNAFPALDISSLINFDVFPKEIFKSYHVAQINSVERWTKLLKKKNLIIPLTQHLSSQNSQFMNFNIYAKNNSFENIVMSLSSKNSITKMTNHMFFAVETRLVMYTYIWFFITHNMCVVEKTLLAAPMFRYVFEKLNEGFPKKSRAYDSNIDDIFFDAQNAAGVTKTIHDLKSLINLFDKILEKQNQFYGCKSCAKRNNVNFNDSKRNYIEEEEVSSLMVILNAINAKIGNIKKKSITKHEDFCDGRDYRSYIIYIEHFFMCLKDTSSHVFHTQIHSTNFSANAASSSNGVRAATPIPERVFFKRKSLVSAKKVKKITHKPILYCCQDTLCKLCESCLSNLDIIIQKKGTKKLGADILIQNLKTCKGGDIQMKRINFLPASINECKKFYSTPLSIQEMISLKDYNIMFIDVFRNNNATQHLVSIFRMESSVYYHEFFAFATPFSQDYDTTIPKCREVCTTYLLKNKSELGHFLKMYIDYGKKKYNAVSDSIMIKRCTIDTDKMKEMFSERLQKFEKSYPFY